MKKFSLLLVALSSILSINAQVLFHKFLAQADATGYLYRCIQTNDGGYAAIGFISDNVLFNNDFIIARLNSVGEKVWMESIYSPDSDEFTDIIETSDGGLVAVGTSLNSDNFITQGVIERFNSNGTKAWCKTYSTIGRSSTANKIQKDADGNLFVMGTVEVTGNSNDYYIMKLDANGNILQQNTFGTVNSDFALSFMRKSNGDFIIGGWGNNGSGESIQVIKLNASLSVAWNKFISGSTSYFSYDVREKSNGNIVLAGRFDDNVTSYDVLIMELDNSTGDITWAKQYSADDDLAIYAFGLAINSGDRIAISGIIEDFNSGTLVMETNSSGNVNWSKRINSINEISSTGYGISKTSEGGYIVCGPRTGIDSSVFQILKTSSTGGVACMSTNFPVTASDVILPVQSLVITTGIADLVALDAVFTETDFTSLSDACLPTAIEEAVAETDFSVFPNPSNGKFTVFGNDIQSAGVLKIFNSTGLIVYQNPRLTESSAEIDLELQSGIYFLQLNTNGKLLTQKVIIR